MLVALWKSNLIHGSGMVEGSACLLTWYFSGAQGHIHLYDGWISENNPRQLWLHHSKKFWVPSLTSFGGGILRGFPLLSYELSYAFLPMISLFYFAFQMTWLIVVLNLELIKPAVFHALHNNPGEWLAQGPTVNGIAGSRPRIPHLTMVSALCSLWTGAVPCFLERV